MKKIIQIYALGVAVTLISLSCSADNALTESVTEGYVKVIEVEKSPYRIGGWQLPEPSNVVVGSIQLGVELRNIMTNEPVDNVIIRVFMTPEDGERIGSVALNTPINPQFYEARLELDYEGTWDVELRVGEPVSESVFFNVDVMQRNRVGSLFATLFFITLNLVIVAAVVFLFIRARRRNLKQDGNAPQNGQ